ncbi:MAG: TlpA family protein disulfide reductase [Bacteroidia bacterium]
MIPTIVIRLGLAFLLTLVVGRWLIKDNTQRKAAEGVLSNAVFVYLISLKLSLLLTHFESVQNEIMYLLYGWGSGLNQGFAILTTLGYFSWFLYKKSESLSSDLVFLGGSSLTFSGVFFLSSFFISDLKSQKTIDISYLETMKEISGAPIIIEPDKNIVLNFWATWCPPCRAEMPELNAFSESFPKANFVTINNILSEREGLGGVSAFLDENSYTFKVVADESNKLTNLFEVSSFPTSIVISPNGEILAKKVGVVSENWLEKWICY